MKQLEGKQTLWGLWSAGQQVSRQAAKYFRPFDVVEDMSSLDSAELIRRRHYGRIEVVGGQLERIVFSPFARRPSVAEVWWQGRRIQGSAEGDRCWLHFQQLWTMPAFLTLNYLVSTRDATYRTVLSTLRTLDRIAELKETYAIVCQVSNDRISDRSLHRLGWERHLVKSRRRHYIKRFG